MIYCFRQLDENIKVTKIKNDIVSSSFRTKIKGGTSSQDFGTMPSHNSDCNVISRNLTVLKFRLKDGQKVKFSTDFVYVCVVRVPVKNVLRLI